MNHPVKNKPPRCFASLWQAAIVMFLLAFSVSGQVNAALTDGLVAYYPFNGNTNDESGNNHNGVVNGATLTTDKSGKANSAYSFNGINSYISVNDATDLRASNKVISISLLIKSLSDTQVAAVIRKGISCNIPGWSMDFRPASITPIQFLAWNDLSYSWAWDVSSAENITQGQWRHVVMIADGETATTYLDGKPIGTSVINNSVNIDTDSPMFIGAAPPGACGSVHALYKGDIDEVRIYNRALTAAEVTTLYKQGSQTTDPNDILGGFLDLNNSSFDYLNNSIKLKFTVPPEQLSNYFNKSINLPKNGDKNFIETWTVDEIKAQLQTSNPVVLKFKDYSLKAYPNLLSSLDFTDSCPLLNASAQCLFYGTTKFSFQSVYDNVRNHASEAILNSRSVAQSKPTDSIVCNNKQGIKTPCNNFYLSTETGRAKTGTAVTAVTRSTLTHRIIDFDNIVPAAEVHPFWSNTDYGNAPRGDNQRIPLLLIHGWQGSNGFRNPAELGQWGNSELQYWQHFLDYYLASPALQSKYHIYLYHYPSYKHITYNGLVLKNMLNELATKKPTSDLNVAMQTGGKGVVVLAHSMGGLVTRSATEEYHAFGAWGEKLRQLITLDTPHHGSPAANPSWAGKLAKDLKTQGSGDIQWDNFDGLYKRKAVDKQNAIRREIEINNEYFDAQYQARCNRLSKVSLCHNVTQNPWLAWLNGNFVDKYLATYNGKYILYSGWMLNVPGTDISGNIVDNGIPFGVSDNVLRTAAKIPSGGAAPVSSALWYLTSPLIDAKAKPFALNTGSDNESPLYSDCLLRSGTDSGTTWFGGSISSFLSVPVVVTPIVIGLPYTVDACGDSILITKPNASNHPLKFPYRIFWDYDHENMVNGTYPDKLDAWDKYIGKADYLAVDVSEDSAFLAGLATKTGELVRKNYVDMALSFKEGQEYYVSNQTDPSRYNPLKLEPLFNVLEGDLDRINNEAFIVP